MESRLKLLKSDVMADGTGVDSPGKLGPKTGGLILGHMLPAAPERSDSAARGSSVVLISWRPGHENLPF